MLFQKRAKAELEINGLVDALFDATNSEYALGCNNGRVLNIPRFQICEVFAYASITQGTEYA